MENRGPMPGIGGMPPQGVQLQIDPNDMADVSCENCGSTYFDVRIKLKKLSSVHPSNPTGQDIVTTGQVLVCAKCGKEPANLRKM